MTIERDSNEPELTDSGGPGLPTAKGSEETEADSVVRLAAQKVNSFDGKSQEVEAILDDHQSKEWGKSLDAQAQVGWGEGDLGRLKSSLRGWIVIMSGLILGTVLIVIFMGQPDGGKLAQIKKSDETLVEELRLSGQEGAGTDLDEKIGLSEDADRLAEAAEACLNGYYSAATPAELLPHCRQTGSLYERMSLYYQTHDFEVPTGLESFRLLKSQFVKFGDGKGVQTYIAKAKLGKDDFGVALLCEERGELKVDWEATVGFQEMNFEELPGISEPGPYEVRCSVEPVRFDILGYPAESYLCLRLRAPKLENPCYVYLSWDDAELMVTLKPVLDEWLAEGPEPREVTLRVSPIQHTSETHFFEVKEIVSWSWLGSR